MSPIWQHVIHTTCHPYHNMPSIRHILFTPATKYSDLLLSCSEKLSLFSTLEFDFPFTVFVHYKAYTTQESYSYSFIRDSNNMLWGFSLCERTCLMQQSWASRGECPIQLRAWPPSQQSLNPLAIPIITVAHRTCLVHFFVQQTLWGIYQQPDSWGMEIQPLKSRVCVKIQLVSSRKRERVSL